jgi:signal transduction histidine kinase
MDTLANEMDPYRVLISPVTIEGRPFTLNVRINLVETADIIKSILFLFCLILITLLIGLFFITKRLSKKLWRPFYTTLEQVEKFELDKNINTEFAQSDTEEFSRLNQSVSTLLTRNVAVYNSQKEFIENAAHELQTPLAVFQAKLDTLIQQLPFSNELGNTLSDLTDAASRLNRLNKNLLLLSKIENNQYAPSEEISANDIVKKIADFFTEQAEEKNISVQINQIALLAIKANTTLFEIIISNLLLNALRHNKLNGKIVVTLDRSTLTISNTSSSKALSTEKLFHRFSHHGSQGSGLGLAIVKKISDLHAWKIDYSYQEEMHIFRIVF